MALLLQLKKLMPSHSTWPRDAVILIHPSPQAVMGLVLSASPILGQVAAMVPVNVQ